MEKSLGRYRNQTLPRTVQGAGQEDAMATQRFKPGRNRTISPGEVILGHLSRPAPSTFADAVSQQAHEHLSENRLGKLSKQISVRIGGYLRATIASYNTTNGICSVLLLPVLVF